MFCDCRFPRFIQIREDKGTEDASGPDVIVDLYNKQTRKMTSAQEQLAAREQQVTGEKEAAQVPTQTAACCVMHL